MKEYNDLTQKLEQLSPISVGYIINLYILAFFTIDVMSFNEFPEIPFFVKGYFDGLFKKIEALESDVLSLQDLIELWHIDGKNERLSLDNIMYLHLVLFNLRNLRVRKLPSLELVGKEELSHTYYKKLLPLYSNKLHLLKCSLVKWLKTSFPVENERKFDFVNKLKTRESGFRLDGGGP